MVIVTIAVVSNTVMELRQGHCWRWKLYVQELKILNAIYPWGNWGHKDQHYLTHGHEVFKVELGHGNLLTNLQWSLCSHKTTSCLSLASSQLPSLLIPNTLFKVWEIHELWPLYHLYQKRGAEVIVWTDNSSSNWSGRDERDTVCGIPGKQFYFILSDSPPTQCSLTSYKRRDEL